MPLEGVNRLFDSIVGIMSNMYRATIATRTLETSDGGGKLAFIQARGRGDPENNDGEIIQEDDLDHVSHFGFDSHPPADTELAIIELDAGEVVIGERDEMSTSVPDCALGDTKIYDAAHQYIHLDKDSKITIKSPVGNVEVIAKAGTRVRLGHDGATYRDIAYAHTTQAGASQVACGSGLNTWTKTVNDDLDDIKTDLTEIRAKLIQTQSTLACVNANAASTASVGGTATNLICSAPAAPAVLVTAPSTEPIAVDTDHSYVSSGSAKAEVEP